ncbi:MAG: response regulator [candidate division Zixibacteria bacterium]|nr:response regulator [candidate division Zixibacteria bacterium]
MTLDNNKGTVVIVDDEEMVLTSLSTLLSLETDYDVKTFVSATKAVEYLESNTVDLIISDFLMPEMNGLEFLTKAKSFRPEVPRIILTGFADKENAIKLINEIGLFQYIEKPWDNGDLLLIVRNALEKRRLLAKLLDKVKEIEGIRQAVLEAFI